jgi:hypothetical protein
MSALCPARSYTRRCSVCRPGPGNGALPVRLVKSGAPVAAGSASQAIRQPLNPHWPSWIRHCTPGGASARPYHAFQRAPETNASGSTKGVGGSVVHR